MSKSNAFENDWLQFIFNKVPIANIADNAATGLLADLYIAYHTADPGEAGNQSTSEASYGGYARVAVARTAGGWTVTGNSVSPVSDVTFPTASSGSQTLTHFSVGTAASGTGKILYSGTATPNIAVSTGVTPVLAKETTITED